jgi:TetR/AcrR family transcriptional regulator
MTVVSDKDEADASRRETILKVAIEEFSAKGIAAVRVDEIARRAGCNKALIYYYFTNKEGLYDAVFAKLIASNREMWAQTAATSSFAAWHHRFVDWSRRHIDDPWLRLMAMEGLSDTGVAPLEEERSRVLATTVKVVVRAQGSGEIDPDLDPEMVALAFCSIAMLPRIMPQFARMVVGMSPTEQAFFDRLGEFLAVLGRRLAPQEQPHTRATGNEVS